MYSVDYRGAKVYNKIMVDLGINVIILRVKHNALDEAWNIPLFGKTLEGWVASALNAPFKTIEASAVIDLTDKIAAAVDKNKPVTVVLYCDTPLVTKGTVLGAVERLNKNKLEFVKLPRGCVFNTEYLLKSESLFVQEPAGGGEFEAVTDCETLSRVSDNIRRRILRYHASNGVLIYDFSNTHIDCDVVNEKGAVIEPYNFIKGKSIIKSGAHIMPGNYIENSIIGENVRVDSSRIYGSLVSADSKVGPFAYLRPDSVVGRGCRIGDFVELKNCVIGNGSKVSHLTYIGDAELGNDCNVGCGVVFANYDGKNKYRSVIGERVFIGSNSNIIAPVTVEDRAFIAAGSTITDGVPRQALAIARARQTNIPEWKGNMYAPPSGNPQPRAYDFAPVSYADGVIDGSSTAADIQKKDSDGNGADGK